MKVLFCLFLVCFLVSCKKEKSFADDINLQYSKAEKLSFQKFNGDINEAYTSLIYIGKKFPKLILNIIKTS